jgi:hypothetical protein
MSMHRVSEKTEEARKVLGQLANNVVQAQTQAKKDLAGLDEETDKVLIAARAAIEAIDNQRQPLLEELDELSFVIEGEEEAVDQTEPPAAPAAVVAEPAPAPVVEPKPVRVPPAVDMTEVNTTKQRVLNPLIWSGFQLLFVAIGLLVSLIYANDHYEDAGSHIHGDWSWVFTLLYFIAVLGIGMLIGSLIGIYVEKAWKEFQRRRQQ